MSVKLDNVKKQSKPSETPDENKKTPDAMSFFKPVNNLPEGRKERVVNIIGLASSARDLPDTGENWGINYAYVHGNLHTLFLMDGFHEGMQCSTYFEGRYGISFKDALLGSPNMRIISNVYTESFGNFTDPKTMQPIGHPVKITPFNLEGANQILKMTYYTSSIAYAMAQAIMEGVDRIRLYGIEIFSSSDANEYNYQRECLTDWCIAAISRGIKVDVPFMLIRTVTNNQNQYGYKKPLNKYELK